MSQGGSAIDERCATVASPRLSAHTVDKYNGPREGHWKVESDEGSFIDADCPTVVDYLPIQHGDDEAHLSGRLARKLIKDNTLQKLKRAKLQEAKSEYTAPPQIKQQSKSKPFVIPILSKPSTSKAQPVSKSKEKSMAMQAVAKALKKQQPVAAKVLSKSEDKKASKHMKTKHNIAAEEEGEEHAPVKHGLRLVGTDGKQILIEMSSDVMDLFHRPVSEVSSGRKKGQSLKPEESIPAEALFVPQLEESQPPEQVTKRSIPLQTIPHPLQTQQQSSRSLRASLRSSARSVQTQPSPRTSPERPAHHQRTQQTKLRRGDGSSTARPLMSTDSKGDIVSHLWQDAEHIYVVKKGKAAKSIELAGQSYTKARPVLTSSSDHSKLHRESHRSAKPPPVSHSSPSHNKHSNPGEARRPYTTSPSPSTPKPVRGSTSAAIYEPAFSPHYQVHSSIPCDRDELSSLELPPAVFESTDSHSTVRSVDEHRMRAQRALHEYRWAEYEPPVHAGAGWVSPYPLSHGSGGSISRASHVTLPALKHRPAQRVSYDEYGRLQELYTERNEHDRLEDVYAESWSDKLSKQVVTEVYRPGGKISSSDELNSGHSTRAEEADIEQSSPPSYRHSIRDASSRAQTGPSRTGTTSSGSKSHQNRTDSSTSTSTLHLQMPWDE